MWSAHRTDAGAGKANNGTAPTGRGYRQAGSERNQPDRGRGPRRRLHPPELETPLRPQPHGRISRPSGSFSIRRRGEGRADGGRRVGVVPIVGRPDHEAGRPQPGQFAGFHGHAAACTLHPRPPDPHRQHPDHFHPGPPHPARDRHLPTNAITAAFRKPENGPQNRKTRDPKRPCNAL